jgi:ABC-type bacteriocin/lantibiotic exporter with double-glycine peptidase domain
VLQYDAEDCGAACLATICQAHGQRLPLALVRQRVGTSAQGTTLLGLKRGADSLGFQARPAKAEPSVLDHLEQVPLPVICHWRGNHWVVLHGRQGNQLLVADPSMGLVRLDRSAFLAGWDDGVLLLLDPDPLRFPPYLPYRRAVMPVRVAIFNVVVDQCEVVEQFQRYRDRKCPRTIDPARLGRQDREQGTKALPGW